MSQFKRDVQILLDADKDNDNDLSSDNDLEKSLLNYIISSLELETRGYAVTDVRDMLNKNNFRQRELVITLPFFSYRTVTKRCLAKKLFYSHGQNS